MRVDKRRLSRHETVTDWSVPVVAGRCLDQPIAVSLEELVPADTFYRHLEVKLDLGFVRDWTRELYAARGRPSIDPVVFFKLQLVMFFEGIRSERKLICR